MTRAQAHWMIGTWIFCLIVGTELIACTPVKLQPVVHDCPAIVAYTAGDQKQAADELTAMQDANHRPRYPMISRMIRDYGRERAALRPCQGGNEG